MTTDSSRERTRHAVQRLRQNIESQITKKIWPSGTQLPTERALSTDYAISRNTVRRLLSHMEAEGWIERHVGQGTFVLASPDDTTERTDTLSVNPDEVMEARQLIEPLLARLVVARASERELLGMRNLVKKGAQARSMSEFENWDNQLHNSIAVASKNHYLISIIEGIHEDRQSPVWSGLRRRGLTDERRRIYQLDHEAIVTALSARDGDAARDAIASHLTRVRSNLVLS